MKKILFINASVYLPGEAALKRTVYLFELARQKGYEVTFLTSDFNHYFKQKRNVEEYYKKHPEYKESIKFLPKIPYKKNISFKRYFSDRNFNAKAYKWFKQNAHNYDIVYLSLPASSLAWRMRPVCEANNCKFVIDVNDLWPESLRVVLKKDWLYKICTHFVMKKVKKGYAGADSIVAVSEEYLNVAKKVNTRHTSSKVVYIGAMLERFDEGVKQYKGTINKPENEFWISYSGTIGVSYDIETVIRAVDVLNKEGFNNVKFKLFGKGPEEEKLKAVAEQLGNKNVEFCGFMEYEKMAAYLAVCDVSANCLKQRASQSIINKIADYYAAGKPVLNCGACKEMHDMIEEYDVGYNYIAEDVNDLVAKIKHIMANPEEAKQKGTNARKLAEDKFDRRKTHLELLEFLDKV